MGSSPTRITLPRWLNWIERMTSNHKVVGSSPTRGIFAWLPERSKGVHLRCTVFNHSWVRTPHQALLRIHTAILNGFDSRRILAGFIKWMIKLYPVFSCSLVVRIARFHRAGRGSIPRRRILKEQTANIIILANYQQLFVMLG